MEVIQYPHSPISSIDALSGLLQVPAQILIQLADRHSSLYRQNPPKIKPNGKVRITYSVSDDLKAVQRSIVKNIFHKVIYPRYLQGSIRDKARPRTYDSDASIHAGSPLIISEDVSDFFPSIKERYVNEMWKHLFGFSPDVSDVLTKLTTYNGIVPQGGVTSSYIANLILWDVEPAVIRSLEEKGLTYTRYIDDITISKQTNKWLPPHVFEDSIRLVYAMFSSKELKVNRKKHKIMSGNKRMEVHGLNVNSGRPTMTKIKRNNIRLSVYNLLCMANDTGRKGSDYKKRYNSVVGKVRELRKFHKEAGDKYLSELGNVPPV